ncbi:hypothetical protein HK407_05g10500 [Ordospora pajunii]|uniref:uncharacterized protein n=1 Tax=Ordospora pajunii TaxID=3039483 RepID=UPI00295270E3|nr:uncharacterized protein HK407_05g10500 [Ordospora pajunii]KAH9411382.1 hypothetical protein HK407_05g10500 [Ordospora pajunii]
MDEFISLLSVLKKNDKIVQNVLFMISEGFRYKEDVIGEALMRQYGGHSNMDAVLDFILLLCSKNPRYLDYFKQRRREFSGDHEFVKLLCREGDSGCKRVKTDIEDGNIIGCGGFIEETETGMMNKEEAKKESKSMQTTKAEKGIFEEAVVKNAGNRKECDAQTLNNEYLQENADPFILYLPNQCKLCGLRYESSKGGDEQMGMHVEEHRRKARVMGEKDCVSREFFPTLEAWTKNIEKIKLKLEVEKVEKIAHSGGAVFCGVCHNRIEVEWDDNEDTWMLKDAVPLEKAGRTNFCHRKCVL